MALEAVQFIRNEEKAAADRIQEAGARHEQILADAQAQIKALRLRQQEQDAQTAAQLRQEAEQQAAARCAAEHAKTEKQLDALRARIEAKREQAVCAVMARLAGTPAP